MNEMPDYRGDDHEDDGDVGYDGSGLGCLRLLNQIPQTYLVFYKLAGAKVFGGFCLEDVCLLLHFLDNKLFPDVVFVLAA